MPRKMAKSDRSSGKSDTQLANSLILGEKFSDTPMANLPSIWHCFGAKVQLTLYI